MDKLNKDDKVRRRWESVYQESSLDELPWEEGGPAAELVELIQSGMVEKGNVLDICCGSGNNAIYLAQQGFTCYGIDISPTAIGHARQKAAEDGISCRLTSGNALELPYKDGTFTLVFDRGCFHSFLPKERETYIRGIHRVLKPSGKYQLLCFSTKDHRGGAPYSFSSNDIQRYFSPLFKIHHIKEMVFKRHGTHHYFLSVLMEKPA